MILFSYINSLLRNPFRDAFARVNKDVHYSIIYSDKSNINLLWKNGLVDKACCENMRNSIRIPRIQHKRQPGVAV